MSTSRQSNSQFRAGSGTYSCLACGKKTRDTGQGEGDLRLCAACLDEAGLENEHMDEGHDDPVAGCPLCPATPTQEKERDMPAKKQPNNIRDLREYKQLSQDKVAEAAGLTYSQFVRIEAGEGKTTPEEVAHVMAVLKEMEPGSRKLAGRPFKDPEKQAAVQKAREEGRSVAEAMGLNVIPMTPQKVAAAKKTATKKTPAKKTGGDLGAALSKKKA